MTLQEIFDISVKHLLNQNERSLGPDDDGHSICLYRSDNGLQCAAGPLIPDDKYTRSMEGKSFGRVSEIYNLPYNEQQVRFICALQIIHDTWNPVMWREQLEDIAKMYNLKFNPPDNTLN